ncbi:CHAD domain-containing protein [Patulibacter sp. NPDC049589]|uniref:CYTH and CHAD domain-containing protein n=1 Tax=Patulibacter sp. NPDC049589 TaxID=3154731 RepID=UPI00344ABD8E
MGIEIERKFLVDADPAEQGPSVTAVRAWAIRQGYVTPAGSDPEVRVRHARLVAVRTGEPADGAVVRQLTTKASSGDGQGAVTRVEVEVAIDEEEFRELWDVTAGRRVEKLRTEYALDDAAGRRIAFTVDRFHGVLGGLELAEIEFEDGDAARAFVAPAFLGAEVSDDPRYRNAELAGAIAPPSGPPPVHDDGQAAAAAAAAPAEPPAGDAAGFAPPGTGQQEGMAYRIAPDEPLGEGLRRSARDQLEGAVDALEHRYATDPGKAIHDARKRIKKTRALLRLARPAVGREVARRENAALRAAAATLSAARDADVLVQTVDDLATRYAGHLPSTTFEIVRHELGDPGEERATPPVADALDGLRAVLGRVDSWPLAGATDADVLAGEGVAYAAGHGDLPKPGTRPTAEELHDWRKRVKDLWYHQLLLRSAWPAVLEAQAEEAHHLSEVLGDDHDLSVLRDRLTGAPLDDPAADVDGLLELIDRRRGELLDEAVGLGRRVYAEKPAAHAKRLRRYVRAWQASAA